MTCPNSENHHETEALALAHLILPTTCNGVPWASKNTFYKKTWNVHRVCNLSAQKVILLKNGGSIVASRSAILERTLQRGSLWKMNLGVTMAHGDDHSTGKSWVKEAHYPTSPRHKTHCQAWQVQVDTRGEFRGIHWSYLCSGVQNWSGERKKSNNHQTWFNKQHNLRCAVRCSLMFGTSERK